jgi:tRNA-binding protein|tara:strand:+ start:361 stop:696 length:336 start_codon:yes stop_codon:yes gene_type:complete
LKNLIDIKEFNLIDIRIGSILKASVFKEARKPAYKLVIDFGLLGTLNSSAQLTKLYSIPQLIGKNVVVVINIGKRKIHNYTSECLVLGIMTKNGVSLLKPNQNNLNGFIVS